jgi:hypothetical protein
MKTLYIIYFAIAMTLAAGCGDNSDVTPADGGSDACVQAEGNCGCVFHEDISYVTGKTTTTVTCPPATK